jgi:hypothetical protein
VFADEKCIRTRREKRFDVVFSVDPAFDNEQPVVGNLRSQSHGSLKIDIECFQVAVVDADDRRARFECFVQFGIVMHFDQHVEFHLSREVDEILQLRIALAPAARVS